MTEHTLRAPIDPNVPAAAHVDSRIKQVRTLPLETLCAQAKQPDRCRQLMDMGFDRETVVTHLEKCNYDQNQALESILSSM